MLEPRAKLQPVSWEVMHRNVNSMETRQNTDSIEAEGKGQGKRRSYLKGNDMHINLHVGETKALELDWFTSDRTGNSVR